MKINGNILRKALLVVLPLLPPAAFAINAIEADLAATYSPSAAASFGGEDNIQVVIANSAVGNNAFNDQSGTGARIRVAGYFMSTNDPVNQDNGTVLGWVAGYSSNPSYDFSDVRNFGASVGADLVLWVSPSINAAGNAYQPGTYSAIVSGQLWAGVFAHETGGHSYGRAHNDGVLNPKTIMLHNYCGGGAAPPYFYSNPNIWFNGVQLLGDANNNCSMGGLVNGGDNSNPNYYDAGAQNVAGRRERVVAGPNLNHIVLHWSFTNAPGSAPAGTTILDQVSSASAIVRGNSATFTGKGLKIPGTTTGNIAVNSMSAYVDLPNGIISSRTNITIEIWATPLGAANWGRVCDFGRPVQAGDGLGASGEYTGTPGTAAPGATSASDDLMLSFSVGTDLNTQRFESKLNAANTVTLDSGLATTAGVQHHYAITFTDGLGSAGAAGGRWQWFRDGDAVAYLDVTNHLASIEDVNNWLGRSMWTADNNANAEYAEVRISDVALSRGEILANYLLGPNFVQTATVTLTNTDALGTTSFNVAGQWSDGAAPASGKSYETLNYSLRTPATASSYVFGGTSLKISGGSLLYKGTSSSTITLNNLTLNGGSVQHAGSGTCTLVGNIFVTTNGGTFNAVNNANNIIASLSGGGPLTFIANNSTLAGANSGYTGKVFIGNGYPGSLTINSQARLGTAPATFITNQLVFNRGTLVTTATLSLDDTNRGIMIDVSGGTFSVAPGTTLTIGSTLMSPGTASGVVVGSITKAGAGTLILNSPSNTFKGTLYVDTGSTSSSDGVVRVANNKVLANAHSPIFIRNNTGGAATSTLQLDGTSGNITLPQLISLNGRAASTAAIQNLSGNNAISGGITLNAGGANYTIQSDAGVLTLGGGISSSTTGARTLSIRGGGNVTFSGVISNGSGTVALAKSGSGTLTLNGVNNYGGATTVSGGTLLVNGAIGGSAVSVFNATLGGNGRIAGPVSLQSGATLTPGTSIGSLALSNALTFTATSTGIFEISKSSGVLANDSIRGLASVSYDGSLIITNIGLESFTEGDTFKLFSSAVYGGAFAGITWPPLDAGLSWTNRLAEDGTIAVVRTVSTDPTDIAWNLSGANLTLSWPSDHIGWRLLMQTNNLALGISTDTNDWDMVPDSDLTNQIIVPLDAAKPAEFYKLIFP